MDRCNVIAPPSVCGRVSGHDGAHITNTPAWQDVMASRDRQLLDQAMSLLSDAVLRNHPVCPECWGTGRHLETCAIAELFKAYEALKGTP